MTRNFSSMPVYCIYIRILVIRSSSQSIKCSAALTLSKSKLGARLDIRTTYIHICLLCVPCKTGAPQKGNYLWLSARSGPGLVRLQFHSPSFAADSIILWCGGEKGGGGGGVSFPGRGKEGLGDRFPSHFSGFHWKKSERWVVLAGFHWRQEGRRKKERWVLVARFSPAAVQPDITTIIWCLMLQKRRQSGHTVRLVVGWLVGEWVDSAENEIISTVLLSSFLLTQ